MPESISTLGPDGFPRSGWAAPDAAIELAPGARAESLAPPTPASTPQPAPATPQPAPAPVPKPKARLVPRAGLEERVAFDFPVEFEGKIHDGVTVRRLTIGALAEFMERRGDAPSSGAVFRYPIYFTDTGEPMPEEVLDAVELSDHTKVVKVSERFLPPSLGGAEV